MPCKIRLVPGTGDNSTTLYEMYLFLGIIIAMGVHKLPNLAHYWSSDCLLGAPGISVGMPTDHFKALLRCFHLNDNTNRFQGQKGNETVYAHEAYQKRQGVVLVLTKWDDG